MWELLRFLVGRARATRRLLAASIIVGVISGLGTVALLVLINRSLHDQAIPSPVGVGVVFAGLCALVTIGRVSSAALLSLLGQGLVKDLRLELCRRILTSPLPRLEALGSHRLLATLTDDVGSLMQVLVFVPGLFIRGSIILGCLAYMAWLDVELFVLLLAVVTLGVLSYHLPAQLGLRRFREAREEQDALFDHFRSLTQGAKELKLNRQRRGAFIELLEVTTEAVRRLRVTANVIYGTAAAWGHLLFFVVIGVLLYARPAFIEADRETLVSYTLVLLYMITPLQILLDNLPTLGRAQVAVDKIRNLGFSLGPIELERSEVSAASGGDVPPSRGAFQRLELVGVIHTYRRDGQDFDFQLGPIDLELQPGELVFLVGGNGSGKTTLAKVLVGLYRPEQGMIRLDGRPVMDKDADDYRQLFSVIFSDFFLFERLLGLERPTLDDEARRYLEELRLDHKVVIEDGRLSTTDLSEGQRKRLALLTAYLEDRAVYVFDEWAADQDPVFKQIFYLEILEGLRRRGKALVVISHDDRYYHLADRIVRLEEGRLG